MCDREQAIDELRRLLARSSDEEIERFVLEDPHGLCFWVDWREFDENIITACEGCIESGQLSGAREGGEVIIRYKGRAVQVPLVEGVADRGITVRTLNDVLNPDYQIRFVVSSHGSDTLAFLPLPSSIWESFEAEFPQRVAANFVQLSQLPNVFTELHDDQLPPLAKTNFEKMLARNRKEWLRRNKKWWQCWK